MKKFLLLSILLSQLTFAQDEMGFFGSQFSRGSLYVGSEILTYDVEGSNAPEGAQGDPTFTLKPEVGYFFMDNLAAYAKYYKSNGVGTEYGLGLMYTFPDFYMTGVYKPKDVLDQHVQGTVGKLFQLQSPSQVYLNLGLNYALFRDADEREIQTVIKGLYFGIGMAF
ncbi:hypothetical protein OAR26_00920 [Candidatus Marinimicrobia bacterium]|nr:hypothetical protein [Candidatus Neomarinimicrobiota bacterium]MDC1021016.1 hypothetical protein [Candidatus Neomarinimicrobiota bacterium]